MIASDDKASDPDPCLQPFVDKDRLGCVGASFGGFSVYWLAGHHNKRFKAFIAHDGIFNMEMQYLETEEMWFANWDHKRSLAIRYPDLQAGGSFFSQA